MPPGPLPKRTRQLARKSETQVAGPKGMPAGNRSKDVQQSEADQDDQDDPGQVLQ